MFNILCIFLYGRVIPQVDPKSKAMPELSHQNSESDNFAYQTTIQYKARVKIELRKQPNCRKQ